MHSGYWKSPHSVLDFPTNRGEVHLARNNFLEVTSQIRREACVALALSCGPSVDWSPEVDIAVRLLSIARYRRPVDHGHLIWGMIPAK